MDTPTPEAGRIIFAVDPGTKCGWAIRYRNGNQISGTTNLKGGRFEGGGMRYVNFEVFLNKIFASQKIDIVVFEEVRRHMGVDAAHCYGGLVALLTKRCEELKVPYFALPVATIKKQATGKGNADKIKMMEAAQLKWPGHPFQDDNEADARWIAETAALTL